MIDPEQMEDRGMQIMRGDDARLCRIAHVGDAEVIVRAHESLAEKRLPEAVHHDTGGERMRGLRHPLREFDTAR